MTLAYSEAVRLVCMNLQVQLTEFIVKMNLLSLKMIEQVRDKRYIRILISTRNLNFKIDSN